MSYDRNAGFWSVYWQGAVIATFAKRGHAAKMVSKGNAMIRQWHRAIDVPSDGWQLAATEFLGTVGADGSAASPPFNVSGSLR
jgi:hypothetical protein